MASKAEIDRIRHVYGDACNGTSSDRDWFRSNAAGYVRTLLAHVRELEGDLAKAQRELAEATPVRNWDMPVEPGCRCHVVKNPPCGFCENGGAEAEDVRPAPPPLELRCPDCSICGQETNPSPDRTFDCETCKVSWSYTGNGPDIGDGEWNDPDAPRCASTTTSTWWPEGSSARCLLSADDHNAHFGPSGSNPNTIAFWTTTSATPAVSTTGEQT